MSQITDSGPVPDQQKTALAGAVFAGAALAGASQKCSEVSIRLNNYPASGVGSTDLLETIEGETGNGPADRAVATLEGLSARFEGAVLLPVPFRTKRVLIKGWQELSYEQTQEHGYRTELLSQIRKGANIGVRLGNGLVAVDLDRDDLAEQFKALNPATLVTRGKYGFQSWYRLQPGTYPCDQSSYKFKDSTGTKCGECRCGPGAQSVVYGKHPEGPRYRFLVDAPIAHVAFEDIRWPEGIVLPWQNGPEPHVNGDAPPQADAPKAEHPGDDLLDRESSATFLDLPEQGKPEILVPADNRLDSAFAAELGDLLADSEFYRHSAGCVVIDSGEDQIRPSLRKVGPEEFITLIERHCTPISRKQIENKHGKNTTIVVEKSISLKVARVTLVSPEFLSRLKPLRGFNSVRMPIDVGGKAVLASLGYDASTRTFTAPDGPEINEGLPLPEAVSFLKGLLSEFCFLDGDGERGMSVAIAEMLTLFCIDLLPRMSVRPIFLYNANAEGSGKTLLAKFGMLARLGYAPTGSAAPDETEMRKVIATAAHESVPVLFLDNVKNHLSSPSLEALATSAVFTGRLLGETKGIEKENRITVIITGNGCTFSPDLRRRVLAVDLFLKEAKAEDRTIQNPLDDERILALRPKILSALWALVRDWDNAGRPAPKVKHPSFEAWSSVVAAILEHAGFASACTATTMQAAGDRDTADMEALVTMLKPSHEYTFSELVEKARGDGLFARMVPDEGELEVKHKVSFGRLLQRFDGRIFYHDIRFESVGESRKNRKFRTVKIEPGYARYAQIAPPGNDIYAFRPSLTERTQRSSVPRTAAGVPYRAVLRRHSANTGG